MHSVHQIFAEVAESEFNVPKTPLTSSSFQNGLQLVFGLAGAIALIMIVLAGMKYVLSRGNPQETAKAKDSILYALIGLVICMLAFTIVTFVVKNV